ncbi:MAG: hypothetical protein ABI137_04595 [Antricoccus sp.]
MVDREPQDPPFRNDPQFIAPQGQETPQAEPIGTEADPGIETVGSLSAQRTAAADSLSQPAPHDDVLRDVEPMGESELGSSAAPMTDRDTTHYPRQTLPAVPDQPQVIDHEVGDDHQYTEAMPIADTPYSGGATPAAVLPDSVENRDPVVATVVEERELRGARMSKFGGYLLGLVRILIGWMFIWTFIDRTFGLGRPTSHDQAWTRGGSPIDGFVGSARDSGSRNPVPGFWQFLSEQHAWVNIVLMVLIAVIGVLLVLGFGMWFSCVAGAILLLLQWFTAWPIKDNLFLNSALLGAVVLIALLACNAGSFVGLGKRWQHQEKVTRSVA